jgi:anti-sigma B factor antagonist
MVTVDAEGASMEVASGAGGIVTVRLSGDVDVSVTSSFTEALHAALDDTATQVVFDLTATTFLDSSGLNMMVAVAKRVPDVTINNPNPMIRKILTITGLNETLPEA